MKVMLIAGARPNFMKISPIARAFNKYPKELDYKIVHTGQHYDVKMSDIFFKELGIRPPDYRLGVSGGTHAEQTAKIMIEFEKICYRDLPDIVLVVGDVNSTLACSIVAKKLNIKVAHVEAGLRSHDLEMPEEINRMVTDSITDIFFVTEEQGMRNLLDEGKPKNSLYFVGHVMIDNLFYQLEKLNSTDVDRYPTCRFKARNNMYGVVTLHRPSNVDEKHTLKHLFEALAEVSKTLPLIFPVHPRTKKNMIAFGITPGNDLELTEPLSYMEFLNLWKDAKLVLTDSGGLQEETTAIGIPCLTMRDNTERPITITKGTNVLVGNSKQSILTAVQEVISGNWKAGIRPELWDGRSAERIAEVIVNLKR